MVSRQRRARQLARAHAERQADRRAQQAHRRRRRRLVVGAVLAVLAVIGAVLLVTRVTDDGADESDGAASAEPEPTTTLPTPDEETTGTDEPAGTSCDYRREGELAPGVSLPPRRAPLADSYTATLVTGRWNVPLRLDPAAAPCTVNAFVQLARGGVFDGSACDRLATGGLAGYLECGTVPTGFSVPTEGTSAGTYERGVLLSVPDGVGSTTGFRLVHEDSVLKGGATAFGSVTAAGLRVVDRVVEAGVSGNGDVGSPQLRLVVESVRVRPA